MRVGDKVRINFPEGASWTKRIGQNTYTAADIEGKAGVITQSMGNTGALEHKVNLVGIGEVKFWERDLELAPDMKSSKEEFNEIISEITDGSATEVDS